ncbi:MAG: hypothetical protein J0L88_06440 [Xanthomonadales bacterium]|nr:hypothetical protein [Xanthomonadales bacterium]
MPSPPRFHRTCALVLCLLSGGALAQAHEDEPVLDAASFAPPALLSGPGFQVDPHVEIRGYMARFTLDTPVGTLHADSVEILADRVAELPALEALDEVTRSQAFTQAAVDTASTTAKGIGQVLRHPIDTLAGIPAGVARYFGRRLAKLGDQAQRLSDRAAVRLGTDGAKYPRDDGPMTDADAIARAQADADDSERGKRWVDRAGAELERELKRQADYGQVRRRLAEQLGIDPYTTNPPVRERLDRLAWVGSGGRFAANAAIGAIGGSGALVITHGRRLNEIVWKLDPESLRERNHERLRAYCRDELLMRQFLRRGTFSPTLQTALADALDALRPRAGGDALLELGMTANSELEARFVVNALQMVAHALGERAHGGRLVPVGAGLAYDSVDGERVLPLPVDYLAWTGEVERFLDRDEFRSPSKRVLVRGDATLRSQRELTRRGWSIAVRADDPGSVRIAAN